MLLRSIPLLALVLLTASACTRWVPVATPLPLTDSTRFTGQIRLTDSLGRIHVAAAGALVRGPSVLYARSDLRVDSVAARSVVRVERHASDPLGTVGIVLLIAAAAVVALGLAVQSSMGGGV